VKLIDQMGEPEAGRPGMGMSASRVRKLLGLA
jgi:hypothetical protein